MKQVSQRKQWDTRNRILDAAEDVFSEKGYSQTSLNEIAQAVGMTRGAIYWHFKDKGDLFCAMCERRKESFWAPLEKALQPDEKDPIEKLKQAHIQLIQSIVDNVCYQKIINILLFKCEHTKEMGQIVSQRQEWRTYSRELLTMALISAQEKGSMPVNLDLAMAVSILTYSYLGILGDWLFNSECYDLVEHTRRQQNALFDMLRNSPHLRTDWQQITE